MNEPASRLRLLLAIYIDYLVFTGVWEPIAWVVRSKGPELHWIVEFIVFALLEWTVFRLLPTSPGRSALGIEDGVQRFTVQDGIRTREAWWTMLLGTFLVLEGSKNLVRWTEGLPPMPIFGDGLDERAFVVISFLGLGNMAAGLLILRCRSLGPVLAIGVAALEGLALAVSWTRINSWLVSRVETQRLLQGRDVRPGEIEFMQAAFPTLMILMVVLFTTLSVLTYVRFRRAESRAETK